MSAPTAHGLAPHQVQEVINRAWEAGFFVGPHERERFESYEKRPLSLRKRFEDLTGIWPDSDLVEWWTDDGLPRLRGISVDNRAANGDSERRDYLAVSAKCWDLFMRAVGTPIINWEEV